MQLQSTQPSPPRREHLRWLIALVLGSAVAAPAQAADLTWDATSGLPEAVVPPWTLVDTADPEEPVLGLGELTLSTSLDSEVMYYVMLEPDLEIQFPLVITARMRYVAGSSSNATRGPFQIAITTAPNVGTGLQIFQDSIALSTGNQTLGPPAFVDTDDTFHDYRIEIDAAGNVSVEHDGTPVLNGLTFSSAPFNGAIPRILWGGGSTLSQGTSEWASFEHNAARPPAVPAIGRAGVVSLALLIAGWVAGLRRGSRRAR